MKSLVSRSVCLATLFALISGHVAVGQDDVQPQVDDETEVRSVLQSSKEASSPTATPSEDTPSEDIPPPVPVPDASLPTPPATSTYASPRSLGGEVRAYDFGISYVPTDQGLLVKGVLVGSPAAATGVRPNDLIVSVNGKSPGGDMLTVDQVQTLEVVRDGVRDSLTAVASPEGTGRASYVPQNRQAYTVPRGMLPPQAQAPTTTYRVPSSNYREPSRRYSPVYEYVPGAAYGARPYSYRRYYGASRPGISIGYGSAIGIAPGYDAYPGYRYPPGLGYGRGVGIGYGRGFGRSGVSIRIGF